MSIKEKSSSFDFPKLARLVSEGSRNDASCKPSPGLYLVATPIGNLGDITLRGLAILTAADAVACEDTRVSGLLLKAYGIKKPMLSYHDHNADEKRPEILKRLREGQIVVLISDAGMPCIADPGFKLVRDCRKEGLNVTVVPGPNAALTALAASGLPTDRFTFVGFLPTKKTARENELEALKHLSGSLIFYESPQRLKETLDAMARTLGADRPAVVSRELTKLYEEIRPGSLGSLAESYASAQPKGEIVILVGKGADIEPAFDLDNLLSERLTALSVRDAVAEIAALTGIPKKDVYARALALHATRKT
ncbi:MAG: 16S rRNA (cytidine(1402)-2'-O)-methyltransferase [Alphaproteobacteria bacterium]|nr:16S rRNA (cytidine(1402)-2'-O)-methyltransferase [Alphaproteobacteria bacterium]